MSDREGSCALLWSVSGLATDVGVECRLSDTPFASPVKRNTTTYSTAVPVSFRYINQNYLNTESNKTSNTTTVVPVLIVKTKQIVVSYAAARSCESTIDYTDKGPSAISRATSFRDEQ